LDIPCWLWVIDKGKKAYEINQIADPASADIPDRSSAAFLLSILRIGKEGDRIGDRRDGPPDCPVDD
jgi:hypothetical protein